MVYDRDDSHLQGDCHLITGLQYFLTASTGAVVGRQKYYPYGETRWTTGTIYTDQLFTGQRQMAGLGIYDYGARFYSPKLGRFLSADTIVPNVHNPQDLNRFSYVQNNPKGVDYE